MLAKKSLPFEKTLCTVKINHMGKGTINARGNQVVETNIIDMIEGRKREERNFNMEVYKVNTSLENLKLGSHRSINPESIAKWAINQKLSPKWR